MLAFLADPATHGDQKVRRIDTHAASVFLGDDRALKIKRAVRFPFLDYSTLAKRKQACEAELAVNAPYTPEIYRGVKAITREADGRLAIGGSGPAVEWAVEMRRFDEKRTLDHLAGEIDDALAEALGRAVAAAHAKAPAVEAAAWIAALGSYIDEHVEAFGAHMDIFPAAEINSLAHASRAAYDRIVPLLTERGRRGLAIVGAVFADPRERAGLEAMAKSANIPLHGLFLTADLGTRSFASAHARATSPMPTRAWRGHRSATTSDRSNGRSSMPRERRQKPWRRRSRRLRGLIDDGAFPRANASARYALAAASAY